MHLLVFLDKQDLRPPQLEEDKPAVVNVIGFVRNITLFEHIRCAMVNGFRWLNVYVHT